MRLFLFLIPLLLLACSKDIEESGVRTCEDCTDNEVCRQEKCVIGFEVKGEKYNIGNPSSRETLSLELINRIRANPSKEIEFLINNKDVISPIRYFNVNLELLRTSFSNYKKKPPLVFNEKLNNSSKVIADLIIEHEVQSHEINGSTLMDRVNNVGYDWVGLGENIYAYATSIIYGHAGFAIDWGDGENGIQEGVGHRRNIMSLDIDFIEIGITVKKVQSSKIGPYVITQDFAIPKENKKFITGIIYQDNNNNKLYDLNEGLEGITVSVENGSYYAVSSKGGAYTIPIKERGEIKLQAFGDNFKTQIKNINIKDENYKLNFIKTDIE